MVSRVRLVNLHVGGLDLQFPARGHRVTRVYSQVHDDLFDLALVGFHVAKFRIERQRHFDILAQQPRKHFFHIRGERVEAENSGSQDLLPAESQQLLRQGSRPLSRLLDFQGVLAQSMFAPKAFFSTPL